MKPIIYLIIALISVSICLGTTFDSGTVLTYGNVTFVFANDITMDSLDVYDTNVVFNGTDNISFNPSSRINITIIKWNSTSNLFTLQGTTNLTTTVYITKKYEPVEITYDSNKYYSFWNTTLSYDTSLKYWNYTENISPTITFSPAIVPNETLNWISLST